MCLKPHDPLEWGVGASMMSYLDSGLAEGRSSDWLAMTSIGKLEKASLLKHVDPCCHAPSSALLAGECTLNTNYTQRWKPEVFD